MLKLAKRAASPPSVSKDRSSTPALGKRAASVAAPLPSSHSKPLPVSGYVLTAGERRPSPEGATRSPFLPPPLMAHRAEQGFCFLASPVVAPLRLLSLPFPLPPTSPAPDPPSSGPALPQRSYPRVHQLPRGPAEQSVSPQISPGQSPQ